MNKKVLYISDLDQVGSGYMNIATRLCEGLVDKGYEVKVIGIMYGGEEHNYNLSIIPAKNLGDVLAQVNNLNVMWQPDVIVFGMDVPYQGKFMNFLQIQKINIPLIGIFPLESLPLPVCWAQVLSTLDKSLVISQFATDECRKYGINADHIQIGMDRELWKKPSPEERATIRANMGYAEDDFIILTVAANQERKNLSASMEIAKGVAERVKDTKNIKYVMVTMEDFEVGWKLRDYWAELSVDNIYGELQIYERGMPFKELWMLYASADAFLLTSRAEGLGLPVLESMSVGLPVFGTDCAAIREHLGGEDGVRGYLLGVEFVHRDVWMNATRHYVDVHSSIEMMVDYIVLPNYAYPKVAERAEEYIASRTWDKAVDTLDNAVKEVTSEKLQQD